VGYLQRTGEVLVLGEEDGDHAAVVLKGKGVFVGKLVCLALYLDIIFFSFCCTSVLDLVTFLVLRYLGVSPTHSLKLDNMIFCL
jgi:hypothetical protein